MSWPMVKLGDVAPSKPIKKPEVPNVESVWQLNLDMVESHSGKVIRKLFAPLSDAGSSTHWFNEQYVLYSKLRPYLNKVVLPNGQGLATTELVPMLPDPKRLDRSYLAHYLRSNRFVSWISEQVAGAKMPRVSMKVFWEHEIPLPPLKEQKRIAAILDKADAIRQKRKQAIELADEFLRSVFLDMFGDPVANPKGWEVSTLNTYGSFKNGMNFSKGEVGNELHCIGVGDFKSFDRISGTATLSTIHLNDMPDKGYLLQNNDLLFVRSNGNKALVGRCVSVHPGDEEITYSGFCIRYRIEKTECLEADFVNYCLRIPSMNHAMLKGGQGANIQNINQQTLSALAFPIPPFELQKEFSSIVQSYQAATDRVQKVKSSSNELFNALSQKAFSGQL
ncbi:restriction endonuclease [Aliivibrio fischeri]|uniref:restriction endonuclease subunit S n=1 Tax=Aliivibrio fischeri TaxID=668 RepID=UPI0012D8F3AA|nr:restriction endonuclease subunit S [Aliivibrio fischeri]MUK78796.1 restriction endonuclease [Aliivibrio fischeri]